MPRRVRRPLPPGFGALWVTVAVDLVGFGIVLPILPLYAKRFHASSLEATLLVAAFSAASFVCSPLWGRLSDRVGRKPVLIVSLVGTAVASLVTGLAGGLVVLFVGRVIDGVSGASVSVAQASVADLAAPDERPRLFGLLGAAFGIGFVAGPAIGALGAVVNPRLPFFLAAGIAGINAVVALRRLPGGRPATAAPVTDPAGVSAPASGQGSGEAPVADPDPSEDTGAPAGAPGTTGARAPTGASVGSVGVGSVGVGSVGVGSVGVGSVGVGGPSEPVHRPGLVALVRQPDVLGLVGVAFLALIAFSGFEATFALFGRRHLGFSLGSSAGVFAAVGAAIVIVQGGLVHPVVARFGQSATLRAGLVLDAVGLFLLAPAQGWVLAVPALLALTVGQGLVQTTMSSTLAGRADPARRGELLGAQQSAGGLARVIGPILGGVLLGAHESGAPYVAGGLLTLAALGLLLTRKSGSVQPAQEPEPSDLTLQ
jgi:DHA1 family tetracycline resistance protein-like MFS transporter